MCLSKPGTATASGSPGSQPPACAQQPVTAAKQQQQALALVGRCLAAASAWPEA